MLKATPLMLGGKTDISTTLSPSLQEGKEKEVITLQSIQPRLQISNEEKLSCKNGQHLHITREVGIVQHVNIHREHRKDQHPLLLQLMLSNILTSAESAEWINPLLLVLLLLLAEVAAPATNKVNSKLFSEYINYFQSRARTYQSQIAGARDSKGPTHWSGSTSALPAWRLPAPQSQLSPPSGRGW